MSLRDQLKDLLPELLPDDPADAIKGTKLIKLVKFRLNHGYSDATLRYHFSIMCCDPTSPIAKVEHGQGYYLRSRLQSIHGARNLITLSQGQLLGFADQSEVDLALYRANKFRAVFSHYTEAESKFGFLFNPPEDFGDENPRNSLWRFPDAAVVDLEVGDDNAEDTGDGLHLGGELARLRQAAGASPFTITSVKMKLEATYETFQEDFFQCLSSTRWAHLGQYLIASQIADQQLVEELRKLGEAFGIRITSFGFPLSDLDKLPEASSIRRMKPIEREALLSTINIQTISPGRPSPVLDWSHIASAQRENLDFASLFTWIAHSLETSRAKPFSEFEKNGS